jgi:hypothetical protein
VESAELPNVARASKSLETPGLDHSLVAILTEMCSSNVACTAGPVTELGLLNGASSVETDPISGILFCFRMLDGGLLTINSKRADFLLRVEPMSSNSLKYPNQYQGMEGKTFKIKYII